MKFLNIIALAISLVFLASCNNSPKNANVTEGRVSDISATTSILGTFEGTMPAADCDGILTVLTVNSDSTYVLTREYIGAEDGIFATSGVYNICGDGLVELIVPSSGEKIYFKQVENGVILSDSLGTVNKSELAEHYILKPRK